MRAIKLRLPIFLLALAMITTSGICQDSWNLGSSEDWLSTGPVYHNGPFYHPNSDLPLGTQRFLNAQTSYTPIDFMSYYPFYYPTFINKTGTYMPGIYSPGYYNPYFNDPQSELDLAIANHAYQKSLASYYAKYYGYYGTYPY